jgi:hypothetical protein
MLSLGLQQVLTMFQAIVFAAFAFIILNALFLIIKSMWFGVKERANINE